MKININKLKYKNFYTKKKKKKKIKYKNFYTKKKKKTY